MGRRTTSGGLGVIALLGGCAGGGAGMSASYGVYEEGNQDSSAEVMGSEDPGGVETTLASSSQDEAEGAEDDPMPPDLGSCSDDGDCVLPDNSCYGMGSCEKGACEFVPKLAGEPCDDEDPCSGPDLCDGAGACIGDPQPCDAPNASGGLCMAGLCMGLVCDPGFGNCNDDWSDGCELTLDTAENCGACGEPCTAGANATATCTGTTCDRSCTAPWADCDGDVGNGCEIPEGVPNQCDVNGLNPGGCWTPWCGASAAAGATNFGTWFCMECSTCHVPAGGQCQWCDHASGTWYDPGSCVCGAYEDNACSP